MGRSSQATIAIHRLRAAVAWILVLASSIPGYFAIKFLYEPDLSMSWIYTACLGAMSILQFATGVLVLIRLRRPKAGR